MFSYNQYVRAKSVEEAYELNQKKNNVILGGMLWLKMQDRSIGTAIDLTELGLDKIEEDENNFYIGAYVSLRQLEKSEVLDRYTQGAIKEALSGIVGVQFRNVATVGGSVWGRYGFSDVYTILLALDASVDLFGQGTMSLSDFAKMDRSKRDVLTRIIIPKKVERVVYLHQRNTRTDFPVLTVAIAKVDGAFRAVVGATPSLARLYKDEEKILAYGINDETSKCFAGYVAGQIKFESNMRAGREYREKICRVLIERALAKF